MGTLLNNYLKDIWHKSAELNNQILASLVPTKDAAKILDIGCADGFWTLKFIGSRICNPKIYGIDIDRKLLKEAKNKGIAAIYANVEDPLPFAANFFDIVIANQIIEHLVNVDGFVTEIYRVLKFEGCLILSTENLSSWHNIFALFLGWQAFSQHVSSVKKIGNPLSLVNNEGYELGGVHVQIFTPRGLKELIELHGLKVEKFFGAGYYPAPPAISAILSRLDPAHSAFIGLRAKK